MRRRELKKVILHLLEHSTWPEIAQKLLEFDEKECVHHLFSGLCHTNELCKWHAVSGFGVVVSSLAEKDIESARVVMRRLLWSLNDESGGIGWGAPEAMAEIMARQRQLFDEYCHMLLSYMHEDGPEPFQDGNFIELPALQRGVLWGVARLLAVRRPDMVERKIAPDLHKYLFSEDPVVQTLAAWCLGICGGKEDIVLLEKLDASPVVFNFYWDFTLRKVKISSLVRPALAGLQKKSCSRQ